MAECEHMCSAVRMPVYTCSVESTLVVEMNRQALQRIERQFPDAGPRWAATDTLNSQFIELAEHPTRQWYMFCN